jgi:hypothetical protein
VGVIRAEINIRRYRGGGAWNCIQEWNPRAGSACPFGRARDQHFGFESDAGSTGKVQNASAKWVYCPSGLRETVECYGEAGPGAGKFSRIKSHLIRE